MNSQNPIGHHIICLEQVDSTNSFLMREKQYLNEHGLVVTANSQLGGRGRSGRSYISVPGKNLTFSVVIHPPSHREQIGVYSILAGIAVTRALCPYVNTPPRLKWPNDVLIGKRKICGILLEKTNLAGMDSPVLIVGIGINCLGSPQDFPQDLQHILTTLQVESSKKIDPDLILRETLWQLEQVIRELKEQGIANLHEEWLRLSNSIGAAVQYETFEGWDYGNIAGLTTEGYLLIRHHSGKLVTHVSGDVLYRKSPYGIDDQ